MEEDNQEKEKFVILSISHGGVLANNSSNEIIVSDWLNRVTSTNTWTIERTLKKTLPQGQQEEFSVESSVSAVSNFFFGSPKANTQPKPTTQPRAEPGNLILRRGSYALVFDDQGWHPTLIHASDDQCAQWRFVLAAGKNSTYIFHVGSRRYLRTRSPKADSPPNEYAVTLEDLTDENDPHFLWKISNADVMTKGIDNSNWMREMRQTLNHRKLNEIVFPGTHDSGTVGIYEDSEFSCDQAWVQDYASKMGYLGKSYVYPWAKTQEYSILQQLKDGIRYFDFKVANGYDKEERKELYLVHFMNGQKVSEALLEISKFLEQKKNEEVIIVDFNAFFGLTQSDHQDLANNIVTMLEEFLVPREAKATATYHSVIHVLKKQLIVIYHDDFICKHYTNFWTRFSISSPPTETIIDAELKQELKCNLNVRATDRFYVSQSVLTPPTNYMFSSWIPKYPKSRKEVAHNANLIFSSWLSNGCTERRESANILSVDFYNQSNVVHLAKHLNEWNSILVHALEIKEQPQNPQQSNLPARLNPHAQQTEHHHQQPHDGEPKKRKKKKNHDAESFIGAAIGKGVAESMKSSDNRRMMGDAMAENTDNPLFKSMAKNQRVQEGIARTLENEKVQKAIGDSFMSAAQNPELRKKAGDVTKSMLSMGWDMAMGSAKQSFQNASK